MLPKMHDMLHFTQTEGFTRLIDSESPRVTDSSRSTRCISVPVQPSRNGRR